MTMKLNTEKKLILSFLIIGGITYFLEYYNDIKDYTYDIVYESDYNYSNTQDEQRNELQSPSSIQEELSRFNNPNDVISYLFSHTFSGDGITLRISSGGISANGTGIGHCPNVIDFNDDEAVLQYKSFTGGTTTLYINATNGTLTTGSGEHFYAQ